LKFGSTLEMYVPQFIYFTPPAVDQGA